jgi:23S rRNA pseudouridine2605 synthase
MCSMMERLQKILARAGVASRRKCEELIVAGRVTVDGAVVRELGTKADAAASTIRCDGERIKAETPMHFLVNKPRGLVCSNVPEGGRPRVVDLIQGVEQRLFTVGRLDVESEGLVIVTNDGALANRLAHPRYGVAKTYVVDVDGTLTPEEIAKLKKGVYLAEGAVRFDDISSRSAGRGKSSVRVIIRQGLNREIRRAFAALGHRVRRLRRIAIGPLTDADLQPGSHRKLTADELAALDHDEAAPRPGRGRPRKRTTTTKSRERA